MAITTTIFEACSEKRKGSPFISTFNNSTSPPPPPIPPMPLHSGAFRDNIRGFVKHCAEIEDYTVGHNPVWCALLLSESTGVVFPLYVLEENIHSSHPRPLCDRCRCIGWSHHFVSKRRYHLIIPKDEQWNKPLTESSLENNDHLLHGLIHCNGFGHLLCINGIQANSKSLHGKELMNLWDHLCSILQTREISVEDLSKNAGSMDLRLLHGVAYGRTWFGKWGYNFSRGSFGVTRQKYERAIQILSSLDVSTIIHDFINKRQGELVKRIINIYRDASETRLVTISDLFQFMLALNSTPPIRRKIALTLPAIPSKSSTHTAQQPETCLFKDPNHHSCFPFIVKFDESRWPARRLDDVVRVVLTTLEANGSKMDRQTLRDAVRQHIGDTGLIDFVIKNIDKVAVENRFIHRAVNPVTRKLVISLQDVVRDGKSEKKMKSCADIPALEPGLDVNKDLHFLYNYVLLGYPDSHSVTLAIRAILDSKHFVKQWQFKCNNDQDSFLELVLRLRPSYNELVKELTRPLPPGELLVVPQYASVDELKLMVQCALRDTYYVMDKFVVKDIQIGEIEEKECQDGVMCGVEQGLQVWVRGCGLDLDTKLRYQGGADDWTVDCGCGAKDDDGERMVACDACHVWQHTRCNSIKDNEAANRMFVCCRCKSGRKKC
uniref:Zinc finger PHD-type domain-containing protein n=1 Tax=Salix viminalis TaxID=40686 RepID=A0A6N2NLL5_SALVM